MADVSATALDVFCKIPDNQDCKLCEDWKEYGLYLQLGLVSASMVDLYTTKMAHSLSELPVEKIDDLHGRGAIPIVCFPAGTMIYANGKPFKKIEEIREGDQVESFSWANNHQQDYVTSVSARQTDSLIHIFVANQKILSATPEHPIFTPASFRRARDLIEGDSIYHISGKFLPISKIERVAEKVQVYNFEVANNPTYFAEGVGVHNNCIRKSPELERQLATLSTGPRATLTQALEELPSLLIKFKGEPKYVDSWHSIHYCGDEELAKLATNFDELDLVRRNSDEIAGAGGYLAWKSSTFGINRLYKTVDEFKAAIARGENVFYIGKHADISPRPSGPNGAVQSHHGVNSVWMNAKYSNYVPNKAPSVYILNAPNHNATRGVFNTWRAETAKLQGLSKVDYSKLTKNDILKLAERQFDEADVPKVVREEYYKLWEAYILTLTSK